MVLAAESLADTMNFSALQLVIRKLVGKPEVWLGDGESFTG